MLSMTTKAETHQHRIELSSALIQRSLLQIRNPQLLQQQLSYGEASQCCPWQPKPRIIGTYLNMSAWNLKPTFSAATIFLWWSVSMLSMTAQASVLIWRGLPRIWNQRLQHQPFSYGEASQCCPWQPKPRIIGTDFKKSASNLKPSVSAATIFLKRLNVVHDNHSRWKCVLI